MFYLFFTGLATAVLLPLSTLPLALLERVTRAPALTTGGLAEFLISPSGVVWLLATATVTALLAGLQQAGMLLVASDNQGAPYLVAMRSLWGVTRRLPRLLPLSMLQVAGHALISAPFLLTFAVAFEYLIAPYDSYYLQLERPSVLWIFIAIAVPSTLGLLVANAWLYLRWVLAIPAVMFDNLRPRAAFRRSERLTAGHHWPVLAILATAASVILLPLAVTMLFDAIGGRALTWLPERGGILAPIMAFYVAVYIILGIAAAFLGAAINGLAVHTLFTGTTGRILHAPEATPPRRTGLLAWSLEAILIVFALSQAWAVVGSFQSEDSALVVAHRGSSLKAPENTLSAIDQAIEDGADYIEIDVRQTLDGTVVLWHDPDFRRIGNIEGHIWEVPYEVAREIDIGSWFSPEFSDERMPTLEQALDRVRGEAGLYVEIKSSPNSPELTASVVDIIQRKGMVDEVIVGSMSQTVVRNATALEPNLRATLFAQFIVGPLDRSGLHALGLRHNRASPGAVATARRNDHELHVWTVNSRRGMERFLDMGVDAIITDRPDILVELLDERAQLAPTERMLVKLRSWFAHRSP